MIKKTASLKLVLFFSLATLLYSCQQTVEWEQLDPKSEPEWALYNGKPYTGIVVLQFEDSEKIAFKLKYQNGKPHGDQVAYFENGQIRSRINFRDGIQHGEEVNYFINGHVQSKRNYKDGEKNGEWFEYFEDGQLKEKKKYKYNKRHGEQFSYNEDGKLRYYYEACTSTYALIETNYGDIVVKLYDSTPLHRDNFKKLANNEFYLDLLFHRVISGLMIQGGHPSSRNATADQSFGDSGGPGYFIDAEIGEIHLKGALAAARTQNPEKHSSGSQFFIVHGTPQTDEKLKMIEEVKGMQYTEDQKAQYIEKGGAPNLDLDYTVFGEVVSGIEVVDRIAAVQTGKNNRPLEDVRMSVKLLDN